MKNWMKLRWVGAITLCIIGFTTRFLKPVESFMSIHPEIFVVIFVGSLIMITMSLCWEIFSRGHEVKKERDIMETMLGVIAIIVREKEVIEGADLEKIKKILFGGGGVDV